MPSREDATALGGCILLDSDSLQLKLEPSVSQRLITISPSRTIVLVLVAVLKQY